MYTHTQTLPTRPAKQVAGQDVIIASLTKDDGVVRVVFATMALGMGIDCVGLTQTIRYGAPRSINMTTSRSVVESSTSTIYWRPSDVPRTRITRV